MKAIQVMFDEDLLERLDEDEEVRQRGRSAVLREAAADYLERRRMANITSKYREAYADGPALGEDFEGWEKEGKWPSE
jgi:predicted transcriptional regulator